MSDQQRAWAYLSLPCPADQVGNLDRWKIIGGDPLADAIALLEEARPFVGYQASVEDISERIDAFLSDLTARDLRPANRSRRPTENPRI